MSSLIGFRYKRKYAAENGQNGSGARCSGKTGESLVIKVPKGTVVREAESGRVDRRIFPRDEPVVVARGGKGGWGNQHFATATRQIPRFARPGYPGERFEVELELKLLADVGLCGFPNVGKSTLISVVSAAKPEIANYHFTTLTPVLGVVRVDAETSFVMADIPGLIEGASEGLGLGHEFLRHVDRCRLIVHVVDISGIEGRDPIEDFKTINTELRRFNPELAERPMLVAGNKCDMATEEQIKTFRDYVEGEGYRFFPISAATRQGTEELVQAIAAELAKSAADCAVRAAAHHRGGTHEVRPTQPVYHRGGGRRVCGKGRLACQCACRCKYGGLRIAAILPAGADPKRHHQKAGGNGRAGGRYR